MTPMILVISFQRYYSLSSSVCNTLLRSPQRRERSGSVMDCQVTGRWERCIYRASRPSQGTVNGGAVSKWPRCRWDVKHNQPTKGVKHPAQIKTHTKPMQSTRDFPFCFRTRSFIYIIFDFLSKWKLKFSSTAWLFFCPNVLFLVTCNI